MNTAEVRRQRCFAMLRRRFAALLCVVMLLASLLPGYATAYGADVHTRSRVCTDADGNNYTVRVRYGTGAQIPRRAVWTTTITPIPGATPRLSFVPRAPHSAKPASWTSAWSP